MKRGLLRMLSAVLSLLLMMGWSAAPAVADGGALAASPTLSLEDLGSSNAISFDVHRDLATTSLSFAVPDGMVPSSMRATLELPVTLRYGLLTVRAGDLTISSFELPARGGRNQIVVPLAGTPVFGGWAALSFTMTALPLDNYCWDPLAPIRIVDGAVSFSGRETPPPTVSKFLPPVLRELTIGLPKKPSQSESDAAVQLATAIAMRYGGQNPDINVVALPNDTPWLPPSNPLGRSIVIKEDPKAGIALSGKEGIPTLVVSGPGAELENQLRLMADDALQYALSRKVTPGPLITNDNSPGDITTLRELKIRDLDSETLWPKVNIELNQAKFNHPLASITVHLTGSYTPLAANFGGEVLASIDGKVLGRWPTDPRGEIDHAVTIPRDMLNRSTNLLISVHTTGDPGHCGDYLPMSLRIDDTSTVEVTTPAPTAAPLPPGFQSFPQVLMPHIQIGIEPGSLPDTDRAAKIAVGLQRASTGVPLATSVTDIPMALQKENSAILVSSNGWDNDKIVLPFSVDRNANTDVTVEGLDKDGKSVTLALDPPIRFGSLQSVFDGKRSLLIATSNGVPDQLDELLNWLSAERGRWPGLNGRAIVSVAGVDPVVIPNPPTEMTASAEKEFDQSSGLIWKIAGGIVVLAAIGAVSILLKLRRRHSADSAKSVRAAPTPRRRAYLRSAGPPRRRSARAADSEPPTEQTPIEKGEQ